MTETKKAPRVVDNDRDEITVTLGEEELRGWSYGTETERRTKILAAREYVEGWHAGMEHAAAAAKPVEALA